MKSKVLTALLSVVIAFGLWLYVVTVVSPGSEKTYYNIPVVLQNEDVLTDRGLMITSQLPAVTLRLAGNRTDLNNLNESNINILLNVAGVETEGTHSVRYDVVYPGDIPGNAITTQKSDPEMITLKVEKREIKQVPVMIEYIGSVPENFIADKENIQLDYTQIDISGPESVVKDITQARIKIDLRAQEETVVGQFAYELCNNAGEPVDAALVKTNVETVNLTLKIQRIKEIALDVDCKYGGGATEANTVIDISPKTILVSGSDALLEDLETIVLGTIDLSKVPKDDKLTFTITLPEGVTNASGVTEATVDVRFPTLRTKVINVKHIRAINVPEGMEAEFTQTLKVTVRGPKAMINAMNENHVSVTVDFAGAQKGATMIVPTIEINKMYPDVGVVNTYSITASLRDAQ